MAFCTKCGKTIPDGSDLCQNCAANNTPYANPVSQNTYTAATKPSIVSIVCFALAGLVLILSFIAFIKMNGGASELADLRSQAGNTVAEAYYNECGVVYGGLALFVLTFGFAASGLFSYLGFKNIKK